MKNRFLVGAGLSLMAFAMLAKDPVVMTVNGEAIPRSEFEYLYHKNLQQLMTPQTLEEYAELFKLYRLKVADAKAEGIDTTASFRKEMEQFRRELAIPYVVDSAFVKDLDLSKRENIELIRRHHAELLSAKHSGKINQATLSMLKDRALSLPDSVFSKECGAPPLASLPLIEVGKERKSVGDYGDIFSKVAYNDPQSAAAVIDRIADIQLTKELMEAELDWLYANNADYRNLMKEYHDGSLLYEVSVIKVWDKAAQDTQGLNSFFNSNRGKYAWGVPHAKGILLQAVNDSVANAVKARLGQLSADSVIAMIRKEFKGLATAEKFLVEQGKNAMVDNILFGGPAAQPKGNYTIFFIHQPRILHEPEELDDVRGLVITDYQTALEKQWIEELERKYPVKVNLKELRKVK